MVGWLIGLLLEKSKGTKLILCYMERARGFVNRRTTGETKIDRRMKSENREV